MDLQELNKNVETAANEAVKGAVETVKNELSEEVSATKNELTNGIDAAKSELTEKMDNVNTDVQKQLDDLTSKVESINIQTTKAVNKEGTTSEILKANKEGLESLKNGEINSFTIKLGMGSDIMKALSYGGADEALRVPGETRDSMIFTDPHYQTSVAANISNATASNSDIVRYVREETPANAVAGKAHGDPFAEKTIDLRNHFEKVVTIGEFLTLDEEQLSDVLGLRSFVNQELMGDLMDKVDEYILHGTGSGSNELNGFDQTGQNVAWADQRTTGAVAVPGANYIDVLMNAIAQMEGSNYNAKTIFLSPADFWGTNFALAKSGENEYVSRQILQAAQTGVAPMIGGAKIVRTNAITSDKYFVVDTAKAAKLWTVEGTELEFARNGDDFKNNQISARIKCRKALTVGRPKGIIYGDFSDDLDTLEAAAV